MAGRGSPYRRVGLCDHCCATQSLGLRVGFLGVKSQLQLLARETRWPGGCGGTWGCEARQAEPGQVFWE